MPRTLSSTRPRASLTRSSMVSWRWPPRGRGGSLVLLRVPVLSSSSRGGSGPPACVALVCARDEGGAPLLLVAARAKTPCPLFYFFASARSGLPPAPSPSAPCGLDAPLSTLTVPFPPAPRRPRAAVERCAAEGGCRRVRLGGAGGFKARGRAGASTARAVHLPLPLTLAGPLPSTTSTSSRPPSWRRRTRRS